MIKTLLLAVIKMYQLYISPFFPARCRFQPTCSQYTTIAIHKYGVLRGFWLGIKRILRCHPLGGKGYDPVP
ncbi:MAG: membrane protein insertion efficiency factor YidD [Nonlabens sp.]